jgi:hypothetical protein
MIYSNFCTSIQTNTPVQINFEINLKLIIYSFQLVYAGNVVPYSIIFIIQLL